MTTMLNLFALMKNDSIKRIVTNSDLQKEISTFFTNLKNSFYQSQDEILFDGRYKVDTNEIFVIPDFPIPNTIQNALINPLTIDILNLKTDKEAIKGIFTGVWNETNKHISFQTFDIRKILSQKLTLINSRDTFTKLEDPGLTIDNSIQALIHENKMLFYSYHSANKLFDLSDYYKEATNEDLEKFAESNILNFEDNQWFIQNADSIVRKKVALLQKNSILENTSIKDVKKIAKTLDIPLDINDKNQICIPKDKKKLKEIIRFLDEDYFIAPLTQRKCMTNSKMYLK